MDEPLPKHTHDLLPSRSRWKRIIHDQPFCLTLASLIRRARTWIPRILMRAEEEYRAVGIEDLLRAVAVVNVPVGNENPFGAMPALGVSRGNRDVVEDAESHATPRSGVVTGRAHDAERVARMSFHHGVDRIQHAAHRIQRDVERLRSDIR